MTEPKEANEGLYVICRHCASSFCAFTGKCTATGAKLPRKLTPHEKAVREGRDAATLASENAALREKLAELRNVLAEICKDSNPDWSEKRMYPNDVLDDIHQMAVNAYYGKSA